MLLVESFGMEMFWRLRHLSIMVRCCSDSFTFLFVGPVSSGLLRNYPGVMGGILRVASKILFRTPEAGAQTIMYCTCEDDLELGKLYADCRLVDMGDRSRDYVQADKLWKLSKDLLSIPEIE